MEDPQKSANGPSIWEALGIVWDFVITVLVTVTAFALLGIFADRWLGTGYLCKIAAFLLMLPVGYRILLRKSREIVRRMNRS